MSREQELYELVRELARIPAPSGKEEKRAAFCRNWLTAHGAKEVHTDAAGNVIYSYCSSAERKETDPVVVFAAHMDVVFPDETELPLREAEGKIFCPGVGDDTANLAVLLMAAAYTAQERPDTGAYTVLFVCGTCEEGLGNLKGAREICAVYGKRIQAFYALDLTMETYTCRAVGSLRYRITAKAPGGHSYLDFGRTNANVLLAKLIGQLYEMQVPQRGKTTYNAGVISGGTSVNTIAQQAEMLFEIRSDDADDLKEMGQQVREILERYKRNCPGDAVITVELIGERPCEKNVEEEKRKWLFRQTEQAVLAASGKRPMPVPCSTDCNIPLSEGIPSVCVGTCRGAGAHTREEYIEKDSLKEGLQIMLQLLEGVRTLYQS